MQHLPTKQLSRSHQGSPLLCKICENVADKAVQAKCGDHTLCLDCIWQWLEANDSCPVCTNKLSASQLAESPLRYCLPELVVHCDNYVDEFRGCPELIPLQDLKLHVSKCKNTGKHTILPTTPVAAVVTASPRKMEGSVGESLARHVVKTKGKTGIMEIRSRGPSEYWTKTTKARVSSDVASPRTLRRRRLGTPTRVCEWWCCWRNGPRSCLFTANVKREAEKPLDRCRHPPENTRCGKHVSPQV